MKKLLLCAFLLISSVSLFSQSNLVENGDFEEWDWASGSPKPWGRFLSGDVSKSTDAQHGSLSASLKTSSFSNFVNYVTSSKMTVSKNKTYSCTFYYKVKSGNFTKLTAYLNYQTETDIFPKTALEKGITINANGAWNKVEFDYTESDGKKVELQIYILSSNNSNSEMLIDNVSLVEKTNTAVDKIQKDRISFYSDLAANYICLSGIENGKAITIYNLNGQLVDRIELNVNSTNIQINTLSLASGIYILKLQEKNSWKSFKFVKK